MEEGVEVDVERDAESVLQVRPGLRRRAADRAHVKSTDNVYLLQLQLVSVDSQTRSVCVARLPLTCDDNNNQGKGMA